MDAKGFEGKKKPSSNAGEGAFFKKEKAGERKTTKAM